MGLFGSRKNKDPAAGTLEHAVKQGSEVHYESALDRKLSELSSEPEREALKQAVLFLGSADEKAKFVSSLQIEQGQITGICFLDNVASDTALKIAQTLKRSPIQSLVVNDPAMIGRQYEAAHLAMEQLREIVALAPFRADQKVSVGHLANHPSLKKIELVRTFSSAVTRENLLSGHALPLGLLYGGDVVIEAGKKILQKDGTSGDPFNEDFG